MSETYEKRPKIDPSEIRLEVCDESDALEIAAGLYASFPEEFWAKREPVELRPPLQSTRENRLATRLRPSFSQPNMYWIKAIHVPTGKIAAAAGWAAPGHPIHECWRRSATDYYNWAEKCNWSKEDIEEMWRGVDLEFWDGRFGMFDKLRQEVLGDEPHWYLNSLHTLPEFQRRGIANYLLNWAIEKADATDPVTPLYLEASAMGRPVYLRHGFVPVGEHNMLRRGPRKQDTKTEGKTEGADAVGKANEVDVSVNEVEKVEVS